MADRIGEGSDPHKVKSRPTGNLWNWLLTNGILPLGDAISRQHMMRRLRYLRDAQWWTRDRIEEEKTRHLRRLIGICETQVPLYRDMFSQYGVSATDIRSPNDLARFPVITKQMLSDGRPGQVTRSTGHRTYEAHTSGSTGRNLRVTEDGETAGYYRASFLLSLEWAGWTLGQRHVQTGMNTGRSLDRRIKDALLRCTYVSAADLTDGHLESTLRMMEQKRIYHLWGYPGSLYFLARHAKRMGWNTAMGSIVSWGDMLVADQRKVIESTFRSRVTDTYGCGEGIQVAAQCGCQEGYHVHALDVIVELVDDNNMPVVGTTPGHVLLTRLHPGPTPFIRYRVGDLAMPGSDVRCSCGRNWESLGAIRGRTADVIDTPSGNRLILHFFTGILAHHTEILQFQVVQDAPDHLIVRVVPGVGYSDDSRAAIASAISRQGVHDMRIDVEPVLELPLTAGGKHRFIVKMIT